jgi:hypothetical protein
LNDATILRWAYQYETKPHLAGLNHWERPSGSTAEDMRRLRDGGFVEVTSVSGHRTWYKLTKAGAELIWSKNMEKEMDKIPAQSIIDSMSLIIGYEDVKKDMAWVIEQRIRSHYLLVGPPACAKSLFLEAIRASVPGAMMVFGAETSAAGLSDALFENQPDFLLADEMDKMRNEVYSIMLALLERGEILVTKSSNTRGIQLETIVFGACNSTEKMPRELLSRFDMPLFFPQYEREEFIDVCCGFLDRSENCPPELATLIGKQVYDLELGDVRTARGIFRHLREPTEAEVQRVINFRQKYGDQNYKAPKLGRVQPNRLPGME